jgi:glycosyltransferase involved in cell wall biosynthesis
MKILHLATHDKGGGGGGHDAAFRLHCNMKSAGMESVMVVLNKRSDDPDVIAMSTRLTSLDRLRWSWKKRLFRYHRQYRTASYFITEMGDFFPVARLMAALPFKPDAIIAHWVSTFVTSGMMCRLSAITGAPLYWYMVDMAPMTGGCHYAFDCRGYTRQCGQCPQLRFGRHKFDISHRQWQRKFDNFRTANITAVVGSTWLKRQAMESSLFSGHPVRQILLGLDVNVFKPASQVAARDILGLPTGRKIIFFGAHNISEERKGIAYLVEALGQLYTLLSGNPDLRSKILVVTAGSGGDAEQLKIPFEYRHLGLLQGNDKLAAAYQSADVFVSASIEDSGPMMINESILCGTPVVSFDMGVAPDLVHTGRTGYRARLRDSVDMATGLLRLLEMDGNSIQAMRAECRTLGVQLCHPEVQVRAFMELCTPPTAHGQDGAS